MELYGVKQDHYKGSYQHRNACTVCWLIAEVEKLKAENEKLKEKLNATKEALVEGATDFNEANKKLREALEWVGRNVRHATWEGVVQTVDNALKDSKGA